MQQKTAVITGGSRGLGKEMAINLAQNGTNILFSYHTNKAKAEEVVSEIESMGVKAIAIRYDANNAMGGAQFIHECVHYCKQNLNSDRFDILINNAGTGTVNTTAKTSENQFNEMMNIHLKSVYFLTQSALNHINDGGKIINVSSGLTRFSFPGMSAYAIMKGAVEVFTRYLAKELGERKITANTIAPGAIATDFANGSNKNKEKSALISSITALGRVGEKEDIGGIVAFLCSEKAGWINGQRIEVSGGMLL